MENENTALKYVSKELVDNVFSWITYRREDIILSYPNPKLRMGYILVDRFTRRRIYAWDV